MAINSIRKFIHERLAHVSGRNPKGNDTSLPADPVAIPPKPHFKNGGQTWTGYAPVPSGRSPAELDPATGLSLRRPFADDNVVHISSGSLGPKILGRYRLRKPFFNTRNYAYRYFYDRYFIGGKEYINKWNRPRRFDENESAVLGDEAHEFFSDQHVFSLADLSKFENLKYARNTTYLIVKNLPILPVWFTFPRDEYFPEKHRDTEFLLERKRGEPFDQKTYPAEQAKRLELKERYMSERFKADDFIICGLATILGSAILPRFKEHPIARNMLTDPGEQQSSDLDNLDMALRFQQTTVEKALPRSRLTYTEIGCVYRFYLCVKNRMRTPIYLLIVKEIVENHLCPFHSPEYKKKIVETLKTGTFQRIGPRAPDDPNPQNIVFGAILEDLGGGDWVMSFDHERVHAHSQAREEELAVFELRQAIRRARRDAIRVDLRPREVLIVDNLRTLVSRREYLPTTIQLLWKLLPSTIRFTRPINRWRPSFLDKRSNSKWTTGTVKGSKLRVVTYWPFRPHRWLRSYYAFRTVNKGTDSSD